MIIPMDLNRVTMVHIAGTLYMQYDAPMEKSRLEHYEIMAPHFRNYLNYSFDFRYLPYTAEGRCYDVAYKMAKATGLTYVEGLLMARNSPVTIGHAWCVDHLGRVVDPTMYRFQHHKELAYLGIPLKLAFVEKMRLVYGNIGLLDGNPKGIVDGVYLEPMQNWLDDSKEVSYG